MEYVQELLIFFNLKYDANKGSFQSQLEFSPFYNFKENDKAITKYRNAVRLNFSI